MAIVRLRVTRRSMGVLVACGIVAQRLPGAQSATTPSGPSQPLTLEQARARYNAGLGTLVEVADAQSLLAQAEVHDELARVEVWRALLATAVAGGDVTPFLDVVRQP